MKLNVFDVVLTNHEAVYFSGQTLQGHVMIELAKDTKVSDIRMTVRGKAFVHWSEQTMRGKSEVRLKHIRHHHSQEDYIDISKPLLSKVQSGDSERLLEAGQYTYPFQCTIPATAPSSFEGQYGYVRYWVKVSINRPWKDDVSVKKYFSVICPVDLNREPSASQPVNNESEKRLCCLCCMSGPITASLRLSHKGYVSGETLFIYAEINNLSKRTLGSSSVELLMTTTYQTPTKSRAVTKQVAKLQHGQILPGACDTWEGECLNLPALPPSYIIGCDILGIKYTLKLRVDPVGPAFDLTVPVDIIIGTVPLQSTLERYLGINGVLPPAQQLRPYGAVPQPEPVPQIPTMFAPSAVCEDRIQDENDDDRTTLDSNFQPAFLMINLEQVRHNLYTNHH